MLLFTLFLIEWSSGSLLSALSGKSMEITKVCMDNKHPCLPETMDCSEKLYATSFSLLKAIKQLITLIDVNYASQQGSYKSFPGVQSGALNSKASGYMDLNESPDLGRFWANFGGIYTGWCAKILDTNQYYQVGSSFPMVFQKMVISGRDSINQFITSYSIKYSLDGSNFANYKGSEIFTANVDSTNQVEHIFEPFTARSVRIIPITWTNYIGGRFEFFISQTLYNLSLPTNTSIKAVASGFKITTSSVIDNGCGALRSGYDVQTGGSGGRTASWCAGVLDQNQWFMITSPRNVLWRRVGTIGDYGSDHYVTSYYITYSVDGSEWVFYNNKQIFQANNDRTTIVENDLNPFFALAIRIHPATWVLRIFMRVEAYCSEI